MTERMTSQARRIAAASALADVLSALLAPPVVALDALSDESVELIDRLASVVQAVTEALRARDEQTAYLRTGQASEAPERALELGAEQAEQLVDTVEAMFNHLAGRQQ